MILFSSNGLGGLNRNAVRFGCFGLALVAVLTFLFFNWIYSLPWWVTVGLIAVAAVINWRAVAGTFQSFFRLLGANPLGGLVVGLLALAAYPFFAAFLILKALGMRKFEQLFQQERPGKPVAEVEEAYTEFEELESKPKAPPRIEPPMTEST